MTHTFNAELESRLVRYAAIDTQSDDEAAGSPSTKIQLDLLNLLKQELTDLGATDVTLTDYGTVLATLPGTAPGPTMAWLAHVDTAPQFNATGVKPRVIHSYNGGPITFPDNPHLTLNTPYLATKQGHDIITASGLTLLGADDKAGVAIIMTAARHLLQNPDIPHPPIRIAFTPDEEIGRGVNPDLPADLKADFAYTFDGGAVGEIEYESFSADSAVVRITGVSAHPGYSKGKLVNALTLAARIITALPAAQTPELTDGLEGFIHLGEMSGTAADCTLKFILRDFERDGLAAKGALLSQICAAVQATDPRATITCTITKQYRNMRYWLEQDMTPVTLALAACRATGIKPVSAPIRGGTDGSRLTEMGVPTPNIFTGMQEIHGPLEWVSVQDMATATTLCLHLAQLAAKP
jgi:tripeptide aminopeptidase